MSEALIAGGGIAGMAAALALSREGWTVRVCEEAAAATEIGAGLQLSPNATRVLRWLGVLDTVAARACRPAAAEMRDGQSGMRIYHAALGTAAEARWGAPYLHVHRADLLAALTDAARSAGAVMCGGYRVEGYEKRAEGPVLRLAGGKALKADLVVGADGIRSVLRAQLNGPVEPQFTGQVAWRGTIPADRLPNQLVAPNATVWGGPDRHLVTYYLRGGSLVNFVAIEQQTEWSAEGWSAPGDPEILRRGFSGWHPDVTRFLGHVDETFVWGLFSRTERIRWADGPAVLLGDAAHPMPPFMAQGAAMALEDVAILVRELRGDIDLPDALIAYEKRRWPRVMRVQQRSRANGKLFHQRSGTVRSVHRGVISSVTRWAPGLAAAQLDWLYGYDVTEETG